jgi:dTDP-4-amino-4,6-dideoxygalactose transaminase
VELSVAEKRKFPFGKPMIGDAERQAAMSVLMGHQLVHGPVAKQFEAEFTRYIGGGAATAVSSCTAALHLAYFHFGVGAGDEVIVPAQTHVASAHAVEFTGAKPVFVDADPATGNIAIDQIESHITERTRAICVVHYLGLPVDMDRVNAIADRHKLFVVEDCALALGSHYKGVHVGLLGDVGCFSFYPVKHITTGEGGMITAREKGIIHCIDRQKAFGVDRTVAERKVPGIYDVTMLGYNYRLSEMAAAIGLEQLKRLDGFLTQRALNFAALRNGLLEVDKVSLFDPGSGDFGHSHYCGAVVLDDTVARDRGKIIAEMNAAGVGTSVYYPQAVPHMSYYREKYDILPDAFPNASRISNNSIALTVGPHVDEDDMHYTVSALKHAIKKGMS